MEIITYVRNVAKFFATYDRATELMQQAQKGEITQDEFNSMMDTLGWGKIEKRLRAITAQILNDPNSFIAEQKIFHADNN